MATEKSGGMFGVDKHWKGEAVLRLGGGVATLLHGCKHLVSPLQERLLLFIGRELPALGGLRPFVAVLVMAICWVWEGGDLLRSFQGQRSLLW
jgi:hypothetical protein